jgi:acetyltransferase-like isoleucine patch superfamily enzyme
MHYIRIGLGVLVALLPSILKIPLYRWLYGYRIGRGVRIGLSPFVGVRHCTIGDHVRIGHGNLFYQIEELDINEHTHIDFLNLFRGGKRIGIGSYVTILRKNVFNAILEPDCEESPEQILELGVGCVVTTGHWLDFTERISLGDHVIVGGRHSSLWTHNRHRGRPIVIGHHCYLGSEIRVAPGVEVAPLCVVSLGSVLIGQHAESCALIAGNPAILVRKLKEREYPLVARPTRKDIPQALANALLPEEIRVAQRGPVPQGDD